MWGLEGNAAMRCQSSTPASCRGCCEPGLAPCTAARMGAALAMHEVRTRQTQRQLLRSWLKASQQATARRETLCATAAATVTAADAEPGLAGVAGGGRRQQPRTRVCMQRACHQPVNAAGGSVAACMAGPRLLPPCMRVPQPQCTRHPSGGDASYSAALQPGGEQRQSRRQQTQLPVRRCDAAMHGGCWQRHLLAGRAAWKAARQLPSRWHRGGKRVFSGTCFKHGEPRLQQQQELRQLHCRQSRPA